MWKKQFNGFVAMLQFYSNEWTIFLSVEEVLLWRHQPIFCTSFPAGEEPLPCVRPQEVLSSESPRNIKITRVRSSRFIFLLLLMNPTNWFWSREWMGTFLLFNFFCFRVYYFIEKECKLAEKIKTIRNVMWWMQISKCKNL